VAFSSNGTPIYSYNGVNWLSGSISYTTSPTSVGEIGWNGVYWLVGSNGADPSGNQVWKSYNGINWSPITTVTSTNIFAVYWTGSFWILSGTTSGGYVSATSSNFDATSWTNVGTQNAVSIAYNGKVFVSASDPSSNMISWSYDGVNWTSVSPAIFNGAISSVKWMGDRFIASGAGTTSRIASSKDGIRWALLQNMNTVFSTSTYCVETDAHAIHKIVFPENLVFSGRSYSRDGGVNWTTNTSMSSAARTVAFNGKQYIFANLTNGNSYVSESIHGTQTQINIGDLSVNAVL
jgi:hypothetical protein